VPLLCPRPALLALLEWATGLLVEPLLSELVVSSLIKLVPETMACLLMDLEQGMQETVVDFGCMSAPCSARKMD